MPFTPTHLRTPIRIGMIGLSANARTSWASTAHLPYLLTTSSYKITALLNSSLDAARAARDAYDLPASTKLYDDPAALAKDDEVDLVVCNVRVDRHAPLTRPSIEAGKDVFVEWPLGRNIQEAEDLTQLAEKKGVKTIIGLQARFDPLAREIRHLLASNRIGKLLSVQVYAIAGNFGPTENVTVDYFTRRDVGGNMVTIHFGHLIEHVTSTLGELKSFNARLKIGRPEVDLVDKQKNVVRRVTKGTHDQIMLHGELLDSGALFSLHMRGGPKFKDEDHGLLWTMYGEDGELRVKAPNFALNIGHGDGTSLHLHDFKTDTVQKIEYKREEEDAFFDQLPIPAQNIGREYESFARARSDVDHKGEEQEYPDFRAALLRHRLIEKLYESAEKNGATVEYL